MVTIQVKNIDGKTVLPVAGSAVAAGYDLIAVDDPIIVGEAVTKEGEFFPFYKRIDYIEYHTALYISPQPDQQYTHNNRDSFHTLLHPRSSVRKYNLVLANSIGLIDNDYRGELLMSYKYIWQPEDFVVEGGGTLLGKLNREKIYKKGDKIGQLVAEKTNPVEFILVSELDITERGEGGHGSTDKPKATITETVPNIPILRGEFRKTSPTTHPGRVYPDPEQEVKKQEEEHKQVFGTIVERYQKAGGIPTKKRYSEEIKEREQGR